MGSVYRYWRYNAGTVDRHWLALAALFCGASWGQAPSYSAASMGNTSDGSAGPFAPNSVVSLYGTNLAYSFGVAGGGARLPAQLAGVSVLVQNTPAPLLAVVDCQTYQQINFLVPSDQIPGGVTVQVLRQGVAGPAVTIPLAAAAPALFLDPNHAGYVLAQNASAGYATLTPDGPAYPGQVVVVYATGLGRTTPNYDPGEIPSTAAYIAGWPAAIRVYLNGAAIDSSLILYAGLTPDSIGLYQINFFLPANTPANPEIRVAIAGGMSIPGLKLAVEPPAAASGALVGETSGARAALNR